MLTVAVIMMNALDKYLTICNLSHNCENMTDYQRVELIEDVVTDFSVLFIVIFLAFWRGTASYMVKATQRNISVICAKELLGYVSNRPLGRECIKLCDIDKDEQRRNEHKI